MMQPVFEGLRRLQREFSGASRLELRIAPPAIRISVRPYLWATLRYESDERDGAGAVILEGEFPPEFGQYGGKYFDPYEALWDLVRVICFACSEVHGR